MNELQQVLLVIAVIVIAGLYFLSKKKAKSASESEQKEADSASLTPDLSRTPKISDPELHQGRQAANEALDALAEPHIPVSEKTTQRILEKEQAEEVSANQASFSFDDDKDMVQTQKPLQPNVEPEKQPATPPKSGPKHIVIEDPDMVSIDEAGVPAEDYQPTFGKPANAEAEITRVENREVETTEPQAFVIIVMSTGNEFAMPAVQHALLGVGLTYSEKDQLYVKQDTMGNNIITVANLLEPGTFPAENLEHYTTPGVVLILQLPTTVKAPAAMHDLIMMSRKISQRLNGRLYNMERHLMKESDLQAMRDAAITYETKPA